MTVPADPHAHPRVLVEEACARYGTEAIARWCADLLDGSVAVDEPASPSLLWLGGAGAAALLRIDSLVYWPRVWAARGLRYAWTASAAPAVVTALLDPAWRVREMAAKVVRQREIGEAGDALATMAHDPVTRVRVAAVRALGTVGEAEHASAVHDAEDDAETTVRRAVQLALAELRRRLDREV